MIRAIKTALVIVIPVLIWFVLAVVGTKYIGIKEITWEELSWGMRIFIIVYSVIGAIAVRYTLMLLLIGILFLINKEKPPVKELLVNPFFIESRFE